MANEFTRVIHTAQVASDQYEIKQYHYKALETSIVLSVSGTVRGIFLATENAAGTSNSIVFFSKYDSPNTIYFAHGTNVYSASQNGNLYTIDFSAPYASANLDFVVTLLY